jgi:biofilm protein TabA
MNTITTCPFCILLLHSLLLLTVTFVGCSEQKKSDIQTKRGHMIINSIDEAEKYFDLHPAFKDAFTFIRGKNLSELSLGRHDIDGDRLFCIIDKRPGRTRAESKLESHRKYIDIQYTIAGTDEMGWKPSSDCKTIDMPYDEEKDVMFYKDEPVSWTKVPAGSFTIFFPEDSHAPLVSADEIHKIVFKVAVK